LTIKEEKKKIIFEIDIFLLYKLTKEYKKYNQSIILFDINCKHKITILKTLQGSFAKFKLKKKRNQK